MPDKIYSMSESDASFLRSALEKVQKILGTTVNRPVLQSDEVPAAEVYIAVTPPEGILESKLDSPTGSYIMGCSVCSIYQPMQSKLVPLGISKPIYNHSNNFISGNSPIMVIKDKFGTWYTTSFAFKTLEVQVNGISIGTESTINFIQGHDVTITGSDDTTNGILDLTFAVHLGTGSGTGGSGSGSITFQDTIGNIYTNVSLVEVDVSNGLTLTHVSTGFVEIGFSGVINNPLIVNNTATFNNTSTFSSTATFNGTSTFNSTVNNVSNTINNTGSTFNFNSTSTINYNGPTINVIQNTTTNISSGITYIITGTGTLDATGTNLVKLPLNTTIGGGSPITGTGTTTTFFSVFLNTTGTVTNGPIQSVALPFTGFGFPNGPSLTSPTNDRLILSNKYVGSVPDGNGLTFTYDDFTKSISIDDTAHDAKLLINGTQIAGSSGITPAALPTLDLIPTAATDVSLGTHKLTGLANGTATTDAATYGQLTSLAINGTSWKSPVLLLAHSNITLSGEQTIDSVLTSTNRVAVVGQTTASQNGIYTTASGAWTRTADLATGANAANVAFFVERGTTYADTAWVCTSDPGSDVVGTNSLSFTQFGAATSYTASGGITLTGNNFALTSTTGTGASVLAASPTLTNITVNQNANSDVIIGGKRKTDTTPTGNLIAFKTAGSLDLFTIDITGTLTVGAVLASLLSGTVPTANLSVMGPAGGSHAPGLVPDPGATAKTNLPDVLRGDGTWQKFVGVVDESLVTTQQGTTSGSPTDLTTVQSVTFTLDETRNVQIEGIIGQCFNSTANGGCGLTFAIDGTDQNGTTNAGFQSYAANAQASLNLSMKVSLAAGSHTIKLRFYAFSAGTANFTNRLLRISLLP